MNTEAHVDTESETNYLGVGLYTVGEAARLLRRPASTVSNWARTYRRGGADEEGSPDDSRWLVRENAELVEYNLLTFLELMEIHTVRQFRENGVKWRVIRAAAQRLRERFRTNHPFAVKGLYTDGERLFHDDGRDTEELARCQQVIRELVVPFFLNVDFKDDAAARYWPMGRERLVVIDPGRAFGKPIDRDSGVPTYILHGMVKSGEPMKAVAEWYGVTESAVRDAYDFEESLAA